MIFYSRSAGGFFDEAIHGSRIILAADPSYQESKDGSIPPLIEVSNPYCLIPADAVEITAECHAMLLQGQEVGKQIVSDENGYPILQDNPPPTMEQLASAAQNKRDSLLSTAAIRIAPLQDAIDIGVASEDDEKDLFAWKQYRVALNRVDQQAGFPADIEWPQPPA